MQYCQFNAQAYNIIHMPTIVCKTSDMHNTAELFINYLYSQ